MTKFEVKKSTLLKNPDHGEGLARSLLYGHTQRQFADVKLVCPDGAIWSHRLVLAVVSPVLKRLLLSREDDDIVTLCLPQLSKTHLTLVLDYVYRGRMYIKASQLQHILGVIEALSLECGVSVSKRVVVKEEKDPAWVEEAVFTSFSDKGLGEVCRKAKQDEVRKDDFFCAGEPVEVTPVQYKQHKEFEPQKSSKHDGFAVVDVDEDSDSDGGHDDEATSQEAEKQAEFRCIMCSKVFQHAANLKVHIQTHLGVRAQLRSCSHCKRNFRTSLEHELHMKSHSYVRYLKRINSPPTEESANRKKLLLRQHSLVRKLVWLSVKNLLPKVVKVEEKKEEKKKPVEEPVAVKVDKEKKGKKKKEKKQKAAVKVEEEELAWQSCKLKIKVPLNRIHVCQHCSSSFTLSSNYYRHLRTVHPDAEKSPQKRGRKRKNHVEKEIAPPKAKKQRRNSSPKKNKKVSSSTSTPSSFKKTAEELLTCPTCDKIFVAKSILLRHLKTSKHGQFAADKDVTAPPLIISQAIDKAKAEGKQLPHFNPVVQPTIHVGGREVNKYECHLCKQVFLRVKDLAKHRERMMCAAWFNK